TNLSSPSGTAHACSLREDSKLGCLPDSYCARSVQPSIHAENIRSAPSVSGSPATPAGAVAASPAWVDEPGMAGATVQAAMTAIPSVSGVRDGGTERHMEPP